MKVIENMIQGTEEWRFLRAQRFTASEAAAVFGQHKYMSRNDLLKLKHTGVQPEVSQAQQRIFDAGHKAEAEARVIAEEIIGSELYPCTVEDDSQTYLASMDGLEIMGEVGFEHKLASVSLIQQVEAKDLEDHYKWQMDHQMMVSGAERILFVASDGTRDRFAHMWYERDEDRIKQLIAGWAQFKADLEAYQPQEQKVAPQGEAPDKLPALSIQMTGGVQASNLPDFKAKALAMIDGIKTHLVTDKDFADAESTVKFLQKGEKQLEESKQRALEQTASIAELFDTIDELRETMRQKRLYLNKLVKAEKENRRLDIQNKAYIAFDAFLAKLECPIVPAHSLDIVGAMKGKKTIATLQAAADDEVARAKIECQQLANEISGNKALLDKEQGDYAFLFSDWRDLIQKQRDDLQAVIAARIAQHKAAEQAKLDAERERIRQEEAAKAQREAAEAEAKRQAEEAEKRKPEPEPQPEPEPLPAAAEHKPLDTSRLSAAADSFQRGSQIKAPEQVTISRNEYDQLLAAQAKLDVLEAAGVDNWSGYSDAMAELEAA